MLVTTIYNFKNDKVILKGKRFKQILHQDENALTIRYVRRWHSVSQRT